MEMQAQARKLCQDNGYQFQAKAFLQKKSRHFSNRVSLPSHRKVSHFHSFCPWYTSLCQSCVRQSLLPLGALLVPISAVQLLLICAEASDLPISVEAGMWKCPGPHYKLLQQLPNLFHSLLQMKQFGECEAIASECGSKRQRDALPPINDCKLLIQGYLAMWYLAQVFNFLDILSMFKLNFTETFLRSLKRTLSGPNLLEACLRMR